MLLKSFNVLVLSLYSTLDTFVLKVLKSVLSNFDSCKLFIEEFTVFITEPTALDVALETILLTCVSV